MMDYVCEVKGVTVVIESVPKTENRDAGRYSQYAEAAKAVAADEEKEDE